jgi:ribosome-associated translation inhibitor RaiA
MQISTTFRDMPPSPSLQAAAERWVGRLEQVYDRIVACHVTIERPHRHHLHGSPFQIHIAIAVPGENLAVSHQTSKDAYVALGDAFRAARRQLLDHVAQQRDFVKAPSGGRYAGFVASKL